VEVDEIMAQAVHGKGWEKLHPGTQLIARQKMQRAVTALEKAGYSISKEVEVLGKVA